MTCGIWCPCCDRSSAALRPRGLLLAPKALLARAMRDESGNYVVRHALEVRGGLPLGDWLPLAV